MMWANILCVVVLTVLPYQTGGECHKPPEMENARVTQLAVYKCNEEFLTCKVECTSILLSSGEWEEMPDVCDRFMYQNISGYTMVRTPCGPTSYLKLTLFATLTKPTRGSIDIADKGDILLHVSFRHDAGGMRDKTVVNSRINKIFQGGKTLPANYLPLGKLTKIVITLDEGVYKIVVDGKLVHKYDEPVKGAKPNAVEIGQDMMAHSLVMTIEK